MSILTSADLAYMRGMIDDMLPDLCNILSESITPDGQGGVTSTWGTVSSNVACRLDAVTRHSADLLTVAAGGLKVSQQFTLSVASDVSLAAGNRVEIGGTTYKVVSVNDNQSWMAVGRAVLELV